MTTRQRILKLLAKDGPLTATEAAHRLDAKASSVSSLLRRMTKADQVLRFANGGPRGGATYLALVTKV